MRIYIKTLESLETRYTCQWEKSIPNELKYFIENKLNKRAEIIDEKNIFSERNDLNDFYNNYEIVSIKGDNFDQDLKGTTFLDFTGTNQWKSSQLIKFCDLIKKNLIRNEDVIIFPDAWDPTIIQLKYIFDLQNINVKMVGIWHAGSYDKNDFLGRKIKDKKWVRFVENSIYQILNHNCFATNYHISIFSNIFVDSSLYYKQFLEDRYEFIENEIKNKKIVLTGQPHSELIKQLTPYLDSDINSKENIFLFPHRLAEEKQLEIFLDLKNYFPEYQFIICQEKKLPKKEYHKLLAKSSFVFSANLQETLGIAMMEGILTNCLIMVPDRLSYKEMYNDVFKYNSEWTFNFQYYQMNKEYLIKEIKNKLKMYREGKLNESIKLQKEFLIKNYLNAEKMYSIIFS